ncbi:MAG TPA: TetR family transcriptional regulator [Rhodospirillaceae bacterium]|nr:TetR family transcriptional regulator [Rhodospirillaceae bacterium]
MTVPPRQGRVRKDRQERILKAAESVFASEGFERASVASIAEKAKLPKANLFYYFSSKEELYQSLINEIFRDCQQIFAAFSAEAGPRVGIERFLRDSLHFCRHRPDAARIFGEMTIRAVPAVGSEVLEALRRMMADKAQLIDAWVAKGTVCPVDGRHLLAAFWAMTQYYAVFDQQMRRDPQKNGLSDDEWNFIENQVICYAWRILGLDAEVRTECCA